VVRHTDAIANCTNRKNTNFPLHWEILFSIIYGDTENSLLICNCVLCIHMYNTGTSDEIQLDPHPSLNTADQRQPAAPAVLEAVRRHSKHSGVASRPRDLDTASTVVCGCRHGMTFFRPGTATPRDGRITILFLFHSITPHAPFHDIDLIDTEEFRNNFGQLRTSTNFIELFTYLMSVIT